MKRFFALTVAILFACLFSLPAFAGGCSGCHSFQSAKETALAPMLLAASAPTDVCLVLHAEKGILSRPLEVSSQDTPPQRVDYSQTMSGIDGPCVSWRISVTHQHQRV